MKHWRTNEVALLDSGMDLPTLSRRLGRSPVLIQEKARRIGKRAPRARHARYWPDAVKARALRMRTAKASLASICESTGVPMGTLRHWFYDGERAHG